MRAIEALARDLGMRTFTSSVHLHLTLDPFDKASGTVAFLARPLRDDPTAVRHRYAFIGDSTNDAACFFAFTTSFGVANVEASVPVCRCPRATWRPARRAPGSPRLPTGFSSCGG